ncbi:MAG: ABC transporter substrate-binding protein [bacterium]
MSKHISRRIFMAGTGMAVGIASSGVQAAGANKLIPEGSGRLALKMGGYPFPRLKGLMDGSAPIEGCEVEFVPGKIGDMNTDLFSGDQVRDVTEVGLHPFMLAYANEGFKDYQLLPVFPLRTFRHKSIFIRTDRGIKKPQDLKGKRVSTAGYSSTSLTWARGILQEEYGLKPEDMQWVLAKGDSSTDTAGNISAQESVAPDRVPVEYGPAELDESDLLEQGLVDACLHAAEPRAFIQGKPNIGRLFTDSKAVEQDYYERTGIFPIMHAVAIRKSLLDEEPWLAKAVFAAYSKAKAQDYEFMTKLGWAFSSLPWFRQELEETQQLMGTNFYSYGIEENRKTLEALFRYSYEQGLASKVLTIEDVFAKASLGFTES